MLSLCVVSGRTRLSLDISAWMPPEMRCLVGLVTSSVLSGVDEEGIPVLLLSRLLDLESLLLLAS